MNSADNTGVLVLTAANTFRGSVTINGGVLRISADNQLGSISSFNASAITLNGGLIEATQTLTLSSYRGITLGSSDGGLAAASGATLTYGGVITDGSSTNNLKINELGQAGTVKLTGANTFGGDTTIYAGTLVISSDGALGPTSGSYYHFTAGTIGLAGGTLEASNSLTLNSNRNITLTSSNGGLAASAGANLTYDGVIADGSATKSLVINGAGQSGTVTLSGTNTYGGDTTVNGGTLVLASGGTLGNVNSTLYLNNATLDLQTSLTLQSLIMQGNSAGITNSTGNSSIQVKGTSTLIGAITTSGTQTYTGSVTLAGDVTLNTSDAMLTVGYIYGNGFNFTTNSGAGNQSMGGGEAINTLTLDPIDYSWFSDNNYNYSYSNNSYATVTQRGPFSAKSLLMYGYADFELTNSGNQFGMVAGSGTYSVNLNTQSDIHVGIVSWKGKSYQGIDSFNSVSLYSSQGDLYVDSGAYVSTSRSGGNIYLNTENRFINNGGSNSVRPYSGANWSVYSDNPDNNYFGGLNSGWNANWGGSNSDRFGDGRNHYNFKSKSTITITANNVEITYGQALPTISQSAYTISGNGVSSSRYGNIYTCDGISVLSLLSSAPVLAYAPSRIAGAINAGTYSNIILISGPSKSTNNKYLISYDAGDVVISPKAVTITNTLSATTYDGVSSYATLMANAAYTRTALVGSDAIGSVTQTASILGNPVTGVAQAGSFTSTPSAAVLSTGNADNYAFSYVGSSNTVAKANLTIAAVESLTGNTYKGSAYTGTYTTTALGTDAAGLTVTGQASGINAGTYTSSLVASGAVLANYNTPTVSNADVVISPKAVTITNTLSAT
ncbi:MAG: autotransporter-associated beta strand repeat-containing protein, partial [Verrucomicrobiota bacterium]